MRTLAINSNKLDTKRLITSNEKTSCYSASLKPRYKNEITKHVNYILKITRIFRSKIYIF